MDSFAYTPLNLDRSTFRLVRLQKGTAYEIDCELIATTLDENTIPYDAVSYTWGSQGKPYSINIQGERLNITFNLWCILHDLRRPDIDRYLWIDAISINQNDVTERAHQVQRMRTIYGNAECVLFCLGVASTESANIFLASLVYLREEAHGFHWHLNDARWKTAWEHVQIKLRFDYGDHFEKRQREGLEEILNKQWFRRVWILQEVASARRALLYYGTESVPSHIFVMGIQLMGVCLNEHSQSVVSLMPGPKGFSHMAYRSDLYSILIRFSKSEASDQHDRIFALLGLCTDGTPLKPDYNMSAKDIIEALDQHMFGNSTWRVFNTGPARGDIEQYLSNLQGIHREALSWNLDKILALLLDGEKYETIISILEGGTHRINVGSKTLHRIAGLKLGWRIMEAILRHDGEINIDANHLIPKDMNDFDRAKKVSESLLRHKRAKVIINASLFNLRQLLFLIPQDDIKTAIELVNTEVPRDKGLIKDLRLSLSSRRRQFHRRNMIEIFLHSGLRFDVELVYLLLVAVKFGATDVVELLIRRRANLRTRLRTRFISSSAPYNRGVVSLGWEFITGLLVDGGGDMNVDGSKPTVSPLVTKAHRAIAGRLLDRRNSSAWMSVWPSTIPGEIDSVLRDNRMVEAFLAGNAGPLTLFDYAQRRGHPWVVRLLLGAGVCC